MNHPRLLFGFITTLGIIFAAMYFAIIRSNAVPGGIWTLLPLELWHYFVGFCLFGGIGFLIVGLIGLGGQPLWNQTIVKHSRLLFGFIAVLGTIFVTAFFTIIYWSRTYSEKILIVEALIPLPYQNYFMLFSIIGGTIFLTVGVLGIGRQYFKNHSNAFFLTAVLVPMLMLTSVVSITFFSFDPFYEVPERMVVTQVSLSSTNPLILSLNVKSFYSLEIDFVEACVKDHNQVTLASIEAMWIIAEVNEWGPVHRMQFLGQLPGGSEKVLTLNFNTTLPSGNYHVWLRSRRYNTFVSPYFTIP